MIPSWKNEVSSTKACSIKACIFTISIDERFAKYYYFSLLHYHHEAVVKKLHLKPSLFYQKESRILVHNHHNFQLQMFWTLLLAWTFNIIHVVYTYQTVLETEGLYRLQNFILWYNWFTVTTFLPHAYCLDLTVTIAKFVQSI